jgi:hypothetical protein
LLEDLVDDAGGNAPLLNAIMACASRHSVRFT